MEKIKKFILLILILSIILNIFIFVIIENKTYAVEQKIDLDIDAIDNTKYPEIKERIQQLKVEYPNWEFKILYTGLDWNEVIKNEYVGHGTSPKNLVYKDEIYQGEWICAICGDTPYDNGHWRCASEQAIKYIMDPRNSLNNMNIFQFEELSNVGCDINTLKTMTGGTFLEGHEEGIIEVANNNNINSYYIVARLIQEQGTGGSILVRGEGYNGQYPGYYNAFNIAASGNSDEEILINGLAYANKKGWDTLEKSIEGGISFLVNNYIKKGQNTLYLQKFDVETTNGLYSNQYMQNLTAAYSEGTTLRDTYIKINSVSSAHTFIIPVYENMPKEVCQKPKSEGQSTIESDIVRVNVEGSLKIRNNPNGDTTIGYLYENEIVTRLEKATSKINGTYWDKVQKSNGIVGYAARETYENEGRYKLYLVPLNENNQGNENNNPAEVIPANTDKVKIDIDNKIILVTPDVIANNILEAYGGSVKIIRADGNFLDGGEEAMATGYIVDDKYIVVKKGDANADGKVNSFDYIRIMNYILGNRTLTDIEMKAADANNDGKVNSFDYIRIMNYILGNRTIDI